MATSGADFARFGVELIDGVSAPAHKAADALGRIESQLHGLRESRAFELIGEGAMHLSHMMEHTFKHGAHIVTGFVEKLVEGTVEMAVHSDASRRAMTALTGSQEKGEAAFKRTIELSKDYGLSVDMATHSMQKMLAMQFTGEEGEKFIKLTSDLRAVGVTADATERILLDIAHIKATGFLNGRELQTFAMAGMSTALIMKEVGVGLAPKGGKALTVEQAYEAMHKKKVTSAIMLPALERAILAKTHEHQAGEAGLKFAQSSLKGLWESVQNMPGQLFQRIGETLPLLLPKLTEAVKQLKEFISNLDVNKLGKFVEGIIDTVLQAIPLVKEFAGGFMEGFGELSTEFVKLKIGPEQLKTAKELGKSFAEVLGKVVDALRMILKLLPNLATDTGKWTAIAIYGATKMASMVGPVMAVASLFKGAGAVGSIVQGVAGAGAGAAVGAKALAGVGGEVVTAELLAGEVALTGGFAAATAAIGPFVIALAAVAGGAWLAYKAYEHFTESGTDAANELRDKQSAKQHEVARREHSMATFTQALWGKDNPDAINKSSNYAQPTRMLSWSESNIVQPAAAVAGMSSQYAMSTLQQGAVEAALAKVQAPAGPIMSRPALKTPPEAAANQTQALTQNLYFSGSIDPGLVQDATKAAGAGAHESWDQHNRQLGGGAKKKS